MIANTAPFDITHHPAMAIPCGMSEGLPINLMLIGKHFDESTIYRAPMGFRKERIGRKCDSKTLFVAVVRIFGICEI